MCHFRLTCGFAKSQLLEVPKSLSIGDQKMWFPKEGKNKQKKEIEGL